MTNFVGNNVSSGSVIYANDHNELVNRIAAVLNGGLDDTNISSVSGSKVNAHTLPGTALDTATAGGWLAPGATFTYNANNGNKEFVLTPSVDPTGFLSPGMRFKVTRHTAPPTQSMAFASASSQYATKASPAGITFTGAFTIEASIYLNSYTGQQQTIISRTDGSTAGWSLHLNSSGQVRLFYGASSAFTDFNSYQSIPLNRWVHIAVVVTSVASKTGAIYINGTLVPTFQTVTGATTLSQTGSLSIGAQAAGATNTFLNGYVSEARIWSTNQSQGSIQANMTINLTGSETNLVALFQGNGNFNDSTSNANNLTAQNSAIASQAANPFNATEYGIITKVASSVVTVFCGTDYMMPNMTLDNAMYSTQKAPYGFPASRKRWLVDTINFVDTNQGAATAGTYYNVANFQLAIPTGEWNVRVSAPCQNTSGTSNAKGIQAALSTANNSVSDLDAVVTAAWANPVTEIRATAIIQAFRALTALTTYYVNLTPVQNNATAFYLLSNGGGMSYITAECAYL